MYDAITGACRAADFPPYVRHEPNDRQSIIAHVAAGLGVSLLPRSLIGFNGDHLAYRRLRRQGPRLPLVIAGTTSRDGESFRASCRAARQACRGRVEKALRAT